MAKGAATSRLPKAMTNVVRHAGRILALAEGAFPYEVTEQLETVGPWDFGGRLTTAMTAHPKVCPTTGEMHFFAHTASTATGSPTDPPRRPARRGPA